MGYLYVFAALFVNLTKGFCGKKMSSHVRKPQEAMLANTIRMIICIATGFLIVLFNGDVASIAVSYSFLLIAVLAGVSNAANVVSWVLAVKKGAMMLTDVFCTVGLIIPISLGVMLFGESVKLTQWIGFAILVVAVMTMCSYNNSIKSKLTFSTMGLLIINGASSGLINFAQKMFVKFVPGGSVAVFNFYTYLFAAITLYVCYIIFNINAKTKPDEMEEKFKLKAVILYVVIMAVCLFASSYFSTNAAYYLDSARLYPLNTGLSLIGCSVMAAVFFKERITIKSVIGIVLTFASIILINVL